MQNKKRFSFLTSEIDAAYHQAAQLLGLSDSAMRILYTICLYGDSCLLSDIISLSAIQKQTINSALRKLENAGMVRLEPAGGKRKRVCLTTGGKVLAQNSALRVLQMENEIFASWPDKDVDAYVALTEKYLSAFRAQLQTLGGTER